MSTTAEHAYASDVGTTRYHCFHWPWNGLFSRGKNQYIVNSADAVYGGPLDECTYMIGLANTHFVESLYGWVLDEHVGGCVTFHVGQIFH